MCGATPACSGAAIADAWLKANVLGRADAIGTQNSERTHHDDAHDTFARRGRLARPSSSPVAERDGKKVYRIALRIGADRHEVDVVQEAAR